MSALPEIKTKIQSTQSTRQITQAMQLVAANKMKFFQRQAETARQFAWAALAGMNIVQADFDQLDFGTKREEGAVLFVIISSDKGLCGSLNNKVIKELFGSERWQNLSTPDKTLITIGRKSNDAAKRAGVVVTKHFAGLNERPNTLEALAVVKEIVSLWESKKVREVVFVATHYVNPFINHHYQKTFLPFSEQMLKEHFKWRENSNMDSAIIKPAITFFEPSEEEVIKSLARRLLTAMFVEAFYQFKAAEYSTRMVAMKSATEAADEMLKELSVVYNKERQANITQELAELSAGSLAVDTSAEDEYNFAL